MPTVDGSSARAREADEGRLGGLNHRATPGVSKAHPVFLRKTCPRSSSYHISHQRGCLGANICTNDNYRRVLLGCLVIGYTPLQWSDDGILKVGIPLHAPTSTGVYARVQQR